MTQAARGANPYRLFDFYRYEDRDLFFGRSLESQRVVGEVLSTRLLVLFAPSGSGKSSLLNAGVRPLLEDRGYRVLTSRVLPTFSGSIASALEGTGLTLEDDDRPLVDRLEVIRPITRQGLAPTATMETRPIVLVLDQFEEFFIRLDETAVRRRFVEDLADVVFARSIRFHVILSIRSDYFVRLTEFREAIPSIFHNNANVELRRLDEHAAREAIVEPARVRGVRYADDLTDLLIRDLQELRTSEATRRDDEQGILPIHLQTVCHRLWELLPVGESVITIELYDAAGGAATIVDERVFSPLTRISLLRKSLLLQLLSTLITFDHTKRQLSLEQLYHEIGTQHRKALKELVDTLRENLLLTQSETAGQPWLEFRHDFLAARIAPWVAEQKEQLATRRRLALAAAFLGVFVLAALSALAWSAYTTYTGELGRAGHQDELVITRQLTFALPFEVQTGFPRSSLVDGGVPDYSFDVPRALTDWSEVEKHLDGPAKARLQLATKLDFVGQVPETEYQKRIVDIDQAVLTVPDMWLFALADEKVLSYLAAVLKGGDGSSKSAAAVALGRMGSRSSPQRWRSIVPLLIEMARDPSSGVRSAAMEALSEIRRVSPTNEESALLNVAITSMRDRSGTVKNAATRLLSAVSADAGPEVQTSIVGSLSEMFRQGDSTARAFVADVIVAIGETLPEASRKALGEVLLSSLGDDDARTRAAIAIAAANIDVPLSAIDSSAALEAIVLDSQNPTLHARTRLIGLVAPASIPAAIGVIAQSYDDGLGDVFGALSPATRVRAFDALVDFVRRLQRLPSEDFFAKVAQTLPPAVVFAKASALQQQLRDSATTDRVSIINVLRALYPVLNPSQQASVLDGFVTALRDPDRKVQQAAATALRSAGIPRDRLSLVLQPLIGLSTTSDTLSKTVALLALAKVYPLLDPSGRGVVLNIFLSGLRDGNSEVLDAAVRAVKEAAEAAVAPSIEDAAFPVLIERLQDYEVGSAQQFAAEGLMTIAARLNAERIQTSVNALIAVLVDPRTDDHEQFAAAIGTLGPQLPPERQTEIVKQLLITLDRAPFPTEVLRGFGSRDDVIAKLVEIALGPGSEGQDPEVLRTLLQERPATSSEQLIADLESVDSARRAMAVMLLGLQRLQPSEIEQIRTLRDDRAKRPWVRMAALQALVERERERLLAEDERSQPPRNVSAP